MEYPFFIYNTCKTKKKSLRIARFQTEKKDRKKGLTCIKSSSTSYVVNTTQSHSIPLLPRRQLDLNLLFGMRRAVFLNIRHHPLKAELLMPLHRIPMLFVEKQFAMDLQALAVVFPYSWNNEVESEPV